LRKRFRGRYALRLTDINTPKDLDKKEEFVQADLRDFEAMKKVTAGMDAVVHLGGIVGEDAWEPNLTSNIDGTHNVFESARLAGTERVVCASSVHAVGFYPRSQTIGVDEKVLPDGRYGLSKAICEAIGAMYAEKYGLKVMAVRIGNNSPEPTNERLLSIWISHRDIAQLIGIGLDHPDLRYEIVYGVSGNTRSWWDNSAAERLGYKPEDNAEDWAEEIMAKAPQDPDATGADLQGGEFAEREIGSSSANNN
jgi:uronate dehydrogenase